LPQSIGKYGDVLFFGLVSDHAGVMPGSAILMLLLCVQVRLVGVFQDLSGAFMSGQMIFFSVVLGAGTMGMGSQVMVLSSYLL